MKYKLQPVVAVLVAVFLLVGCTSISTVVVGEMRTENGVLKFDLDLLKACKGVSFELKITQDGKTVQATGTAAAGSIQFANTDLTDLNFNGPITLEITVLDVPGTVDCPIPANYHGTAGPLPAKKVPGKDRVYSVDLKEFRPKLL